jgi:hypothetical protein
LVRLSIDPDMIDGRTFYPRLALGEYFLDQFDALIARAVERGVKKNRDSHELSFHRRCS